MHVCAQEGQAKAAKFLGQRGIDPTIKNKKGKSPKITAKECGKKLVLKELSRAEKNWVKYHEGSETPPVELWQIRFYDWLYDPIRQEDLARLLNSKADLLEAELGPIEPVEEKKKKAKKKKGKKGKKEKPDRKVLIESVIQELEILEPPIESVHFNELEELLDSKDKSGKIGINAFLEGKMLLKKAYLMSSFAEKKKKGKKAKKGKKGGKAGKSKGKPVSISVLPDESQIKN